MKLPSSALKKYARHVLRYLYLSFLFRLPPSPVVIPEGGPPVQPAKDSGAPGVADEGAADEEPPEPHVDALQEQHTPAAVLRRDRVLHVYGLRQRRGEGVELAA